MLSQHSCFKITHTAHPAFIILNVPYIQKEVCVCVHYNNKCIPRHSSLSLADRMLSVTFEDPCVLFPDYISAATVTTVLNFMLIIPLLCFFNRHLDWSFHE